MKCRVRLAWLIKRLLCRLTIFVLTVVNIPTNPTIYHCTKCLFVLIGDHYQKATLKTVTLGALY